MSVSPPASESLVSAVAKIQRFANPDLGDDELGRLSRETADAIAARISDLNYQEQFEATGVAYVELDESGRVVKREPGAWGRGEVLDKSSDS